MKAAIHYSLVNEIKTRLPILDLVQQGYVPVENLRINGDKATGCCPLHDDRSPSFGFTISKDLWYCFACAEGGDQIRLYARYNGITDGEAIKQLAAILGISGNLTPKQREEAEKTHKKRKIEQALNEVIEARIREVFDQLAAIERNGERRLLQLAAEELDPLQDSVCCWWLRERERVAWWLDCLTAGDAEIKIQTLEEVRQWRAILTQ